MLAAKESFLMLPYASYISDLNPMLTRKRICSILFTNSQCRAGENFYEVNPAVFIAFIVSE